VSESTGTADQHDPIGQAPAGTTTHDAPVPGALVDFMSQGWAEPPAPSDVVESVAGFTLTRREALGRRFPGEVLVIPTGTLRPRANDTDHPFRAGSDYAWLTGDLEPDGVLVLLPHAAAAGQDAVVAGTHRCVLHVPGRSDRAKGGTHFFTDRRYGELWVGPRRGPVEVALALAIETAERAGLGCLLGLHPGARVLRGVDTSVDALVTPTTDERDGELAAVLSELRLVKDDHEVAMLQEAVDATVTGFEDCVRELRAAKALPNGERWIEGTFWRRARVAGNDVGYGSIVASGEHATTLHWTRDDGVVRDGDLVLLDMGVESRALYTADVTRTLPVSGRFTPQQRMVYEAVWESQQAALSQVRPGAPYVAPHEAAMRVLLGHLRSWGLLADFGDDEKVLADALHKRYTLHGVSHHLGLDVHDCAQARQEYYRGGVLAEGMVITVEPGLYFQLDDLTVPEELRGIGVRIEDDVLVTQQGCRVLSDGLPTQVDAVEAWMHELIRAGAVPGEVQVTSAMFDSGPAARLREAQEQDLRQRYRGGEPSPAQPSDFTQARGGRFLLATLDGEPAGCAGVRVEPDALAQGRPEVAELKRMFTAPWARRRGVALALLQAAEAAARELGYRELILETGDQQPEALSLYLRQDYTTVEPFGPYKCHPSATHLGKAL
jgi:Xaa-Pro aminopeptidase